MQLQISHDEAISTTPSRRLRALTAHWVWKGTADAHGRRETRSTEGRLLKELGKSCKAVWAFFPLFVPFCYPPPRSAPFSGLHAEPAGFEEVVTEQVLGSRFGEVWVFALFPPSISTFSRSCCQPPTPLTCSAAAAQLAAETERSGVAF